jgi:putative inorganic carbon (hco3(-)) transporter
LPLLVFVYRMRGQYSPKLWKLIKYASMSYALMAVTSVILTNSRSGMIKAIVFLFLLSLRRTSLARMLGNLVIATLVLLVIWVAMPESSQNRFRTLWDKDAGPAIAHGSAMGRLEGFYIGLEMFKQFPVLGVGMGNFVDFRVKQLDGKPLEAHNLPGQALAETGIIGTLAFALVVALTWRNIRTTKRLLRGIDEPGAMMLRELATACSHILILLFVSGGSGHILYLYHWLWIAALSQLACQFASQNYGYRGW